MEIAVVAIFLAAAPAEARARFAGPPRDLLEAHAAFQRGTVKVPMKGQAALPAGDADAVDTVTTKAFGSGEADFGELHPARRLVEPDGHGGGKNAPVAQVEKFGQHEFLGIDGTRQRVGSNERSWSYEELRHDLCLAYAEGA